MALATKSKRILLYDAEKAQNINPETLQLYRKYEMDMTLRELSPNSITQYKSDLFQWFIYMYDNQFNLSVKEATEDDITEYYFWRKQQGNNTNRQKRVMSSISAFYKFLRKKRIITESPVEFIDRPKNGMPVVQQTYLTKEQVQLMREQLAELGKTQLQAYAFLSLTTMARVNAVANLRWSQCDMEQRIFKDVLEKEGKIVELSFSEETKEYLLKMIEERKEKGIDDHGWVWYTYNTDAENCVDTGTLNKWCKKIGSLIGEPTLHPHDFRHSYATLLKNEGLPLEAISRMLNHAGTDVTQRFYIKADLSKDRAMKDSINI